MVQYSAHPIFTLHGQITAREYVDRLGNYVPRTFDDLDVISGKNDAFTQLELF
jgi:hypothetical protein